MTVFECAADLGVLPSPVKCLSERFFQTGIYANIAVSKYRVRGLRHNTLPKK